VAQVSVPLRLYFNLPFCTFQHTWKERSLGFNFITWYWSHKKLSFHNGLNALFLLLLSFPAFFLFCFTGLCLFAWRCYFIIWQKSLHLLYNRLKLRDDVQGVAWWVGREPGSTLIFPVSIGSGFQWYLWSTRETKKDATEGYFYTFFVNIILTISRFLFSLTIMNFKQMK